jgi:hypothetical protein
MFKLAGAQIGGTVGKGAIGFVRVFGPKEFYD